MKLTIELVPRTCWFSNVRSQVSPGTWNEIKRKVAQDARNKCVICGGRGKRWAVETHEGWSYNDESLVQKLEKFLALCPACHEVKHIGYAITRGNGDRARKHLAAVNELTPDQVERYIVGAFEKWQVRSQYQWRLNIDFLKKFGVDPKKISPARDSTTLAFAAMGAYDPSDFAGDIV